MNKQPKTICKNELKRRLRTGEFLVGTGVQLPDVSAAEIIALAGFDFVVVDTEHGPASYETALNQIIAIRAGGALSMARVPWNEPYLAKR
ncbi:MAG: hypothetical protein LBP26_03695, partial [Clostridiales bacterium]|nr:hypothetical protein [Clostridiales bacterium]